LPGRISRFPQLNSLSSMNSRSALFAAGLIGATGVALGAFGAHSLRDWLAERGMTVAWETAARYQILHAAALLGAAAWLRQPSKAARGCVGWAALCWCVGVLLFCGSLYGLAAGGPRWLGPITPFGGLALLAGWLCLCLAAFSKDDS
jgi:uncharacterized membrane protein YgdD (TMEM256/DUF423 family)